jgi:hypothetical protein
MATRFKRTHVPEHLFVSFSAKDDVIAHSLVDDLRRAGLPVWIDYSELIPGTPDWETAIRDAIDRCFAVIVLASPSSRRSRYVKGELDVAESKGRTIYPVWIAGADWSDCIPLGMTSAQFLDLRGKRRDQGLKKLCTLLQKLIAEATPKHYLVKPLRRVRGAKRSGFLAHVEPPPGFISIDLESDSRNSSKEGGAAAFFRLADFPRMQTLLDDLYVNYLSKQFQPFTYATDWVLQEEGSYWDRVLVPWTWVTDKRGKSDNFYKHWLKRSPSDVGVLPNSSLLVNRSSALFAQGLAINDHRLYEAMREHPKATYYFRHARIIESIPVKKYRGTCKHHLVVIPSDEIEWTPEPGHIWIQSKKDVTEEDLEHFLD